MSNRDNILNKIRAILAKTVDNGCTEDEALAAIAIANRMMDEYEVTADDLKIEDEKAIIARSDCRDPQNVRWKLCYWIAQFTDTYSFGHKKDIKFAGLRSDVDFAIYLAEALTSFVHAQLKSYMWANGFQKFQGNERVRIVNSFVAGCCSRINIKLKQMVDSRRTTTNSTALVLTKQHLINEAIKDLNIGEYSNRGRKATFYGDIFRAGQSAGDNASFGRPVESGVLRLTKTS